MFRRSVARNSANPTASDSSDPATSTVVTGKGRATPKRSAAEAARKTSVIAPAGRGGSRSGNSRETVAARREAIRRGDDWALPPRDRGPVRRFARDYVDARRNLAYLFWPIGMPIALFSFVARGAAWVELLLFGLAVVVIFDSVRISRGIRAEAAQRFPGEPTKGIGAYAAMRAMQFRKLRVPAPRYSPGDKI